MKKNLPPPNSQEHLIRSANIFPVVGIGASAGGLDAFKKFLKAIPGDSGMAYVIVQHLAPNHDSILPELLQKVTTIPVVEITDDIKVQPDYIYIIPSNKLLVANDGVLQLSPRHLPDPTNDGIGVHLLNLPIDLFFTSLAEVHQSHSIGVVLSGTGSDGTKGLKAIKEHGGITFAQDQESALYDGMPNSAVLAGVVDFILPPEQISQKLLEITRIIADKGNTALDENIPVSDEAIYRQIIALLRLRKGTDFTYYKQSTIRRRILRRMALNKIEQPAWYLSFLRENIREQDFLFQDLLIPVTSFFRDAKTFDHVCQAVFPKLLENKRNSFETSVDPLRIWVAACSTGQEVYSIAICLKEFLDSNLLAGEVRNEVKLKVQIFATDISEPAIAKARSGFYTKSEVEEMTPERVHNFFTKTNGSYQVNKVIRDMCVFAVHNFVKDPPFGKMDFISCRNALIYMEPYLQKRALSTFHYALNQGGVLLLGKSETINQVPQLFSPAHKGDKIFTRKEVAGKYMHTATVRSEEHIADANNNSKRTADQKAQPDFERTADEILLSRYTPAGVVVNEDMDIVHFRGRTANYLEQLPGKPSHNLLKMVREGLAFELRNIIHKVKKEKSLVTKINIPVTINDRQQNISIEAMALPGTIDPYFLILFHEEANGNIAGIFDLPEQQGVTSKTRSSPDDSERLRARVALLEQELAQAREDMRSITEDQEAVNEELQSANEELLSGSEELQSLNEELETGKEELQSSNEELIVVNQEMVGLNEQVTRARDYAESVIMTIRESLLVLDKNLRIKSANTAFYKTFQVNELETEGRLIYNIGDGQWNVPELRTLLEEIVPRKTLFTDFEVTYNFPNIGERIMHLNARELTRDQMEEKFILLAIEDVTEKVNAHKKIEDSYKRYHNILMHSPFAFSFMKGKNLEITLANNLIKQIWGKGDEVEGKPLLELLPELKDQALPNMINHVYASGKPVSANEILARFNWDGKMVDKYFNVVYYPHLEADHAISGVITIAHEITNQVIARKKVEESEMHYRQMTNLMPAKITNAGPGGEVTYCNQHWLDFTGYTFEEFKSFGYHQVMHPDELAAFQQRLEIAAKTGTTLEMEMRFRDKQGEYIWHLNRATPVNDENGQLKIWIGVTTVIQGQKEQTEKLEIAVGERTLQLVQANEELQQKNQEIALSKYNKRFLSEYSDKFSAYKAHNEFFSSLVQFIADTTHLDCVLVGKLEQNDKEELFIQTIAVSAFGKPAGNFTYLLDGSPCEQVIKGIMYSFPEHCHNLFPKNKNIAALNVEGYVGYTLYNEKGLAVGIITVMHEKKIEDAETVSSILKIVARRAEIELERLKNEEMLVQHNKVLEEKNQTLDKLNKKLESFNYISSHDLQEPLRKIKTFSRLIMERESEHLSEMGQDHFKRIMTAAGRMQTLIEDLLLYSQATSANSKFERVNLNKLIESVLTELEETIQEKRAIVETNVLATVKIIPFQFRQLFSNLISNSLKFTKPGIPPNIVIMSEIRTGVDFESTSELTGSLSPQKNYCHISFSDNGIGFDKQYKDRIFEVFQRLHGKEEYTGTGIGLAIVKKIVESHNGIITASGELGQGARFDIYIPA